MFSISNDVFTLSDIQTKPEDKPFSDPTPGFLAGRCLLDVVEYLRIDPKFPATFTQLVNAHSMRMLLQCLTNLKRDDLKRRFKPLVGPTCEQLLLSRKNQPPYYGDDLWDWAYTIEALLVVKNAYPDIYDHATVLNREAQLYYECVVSKLSSGLTLGGEDEWFGPATPVAASRILKLCKPYISEKVPLTRVLKDLKQQALMKIEGDQYFGRTVVPRYHQWHYGQVVCQFPNESKWQLEQLRNLTSVEELDDRAARAYALARVIQGAFKGNDSATRDAAINLVYPCERPERPFGTGIVSDTVKGSVNVLEAVWPMLNRDELVQVGLMLDRLLKSYKSANTIGLAVAVPREFYECKRALKAAGGKITELESGVTEVDHEKYRVLIAQGKALTEAQEAAKRLINEPHKAKWLLMIGIAGSLGGRDKKGRTFRGPNLGDVVIATSVAPYEIRAKVRDGEVRNVPVPFRGLDWGLIPVHPGLFTIALQAAQRLRDGKPQKLPFKVHEGLIVTGNSIKDDLRAKRKVLKEHPGGVAVEEESYIFGLVCALYGRPNLIIRGISDLAQGDKKRQQRVASDEDKVQRRAARNAAKLAVRVIDLLSDGWGARWVVRE